MAFRFVPLPGSNPRTSPLPAARGEGTEDAAASLFSPLAGRRCRQADEGRTRAQAMSCPPFTSRTWPVI
ncbi:hypothetical protein CN238_20840 [Sinorhizobium meliloti]|nr:hypothetical protein CN238_20840 [Sinorhizobium meliloti]RVH26103.1 hypothetical protein CN214_22305 [Sinorhizobium meliloti]